MAHGGFKDVLKNGGFVAFLWTQFLGAFNDNAYRIIVSLRAVHIVAQADQSGKYLALAGAIFVLPSLLFTGYAGQLADAISKRKVLIGVKIFEIAVMALGIVVFFSQSIPLMFVVIFLMAVHYTVFSPAKYSIVPELVSDRDLSRANALLEMTTLVAIVLGTSIGPFLFTAWKSAEWKIGVVLTTVAVVGCLTSFRITRVPAAGAREPVRLNTLAEVAAGTKHLLRDRPLWLAVMAISYFWFLALLFQMDLVLFGSETLKASDRLVGLLMTCLSLGIGAGSMLAGRLSGDKVEIGLVPLGSIFMGVFSLGLYAARGSYAASVVMLSLLGIAAGVFFVPLNAYLQQRSESGEKGRIIATNNIYNSLGMLLATAVFYVCHDALHISPPHVILTFGFVSLGITVYIVTVVDDFLIRFLLWFLTHTIFRIRIVGQENVPFRGPALLVSNHMSHVDGFLVGACVQRFIRFMVWKPYYELKALHWFFRKTHAIPVGGGRDAIEAIRAARNELSAGHVVCIFAEGAISRTGNILPFKRGMEKIMDGLDAPIIPLHLDRLWGSIFSFERGRFFWKWPKRIPYPVTVSFGNPMPANSTAHEVRQAIQELAAEATAHRQTAGDTLPRRLIRSVRRNWSHFAMADSTGRELTYGRMLTGGLLVAQWARTRRDEETIGVLLPPSVAGEFGALLGKETRELGFNVSLGGTANIIREARNGRNKECWSEDPIATGKLLGSMLKGLQDQTIIGDVNRYAVNDQENGRQIYSANLDKRSMRETDLLAYEITIKESDVGTVMCAYSKLNGTYACENPWLLNDVLKKDWGFKGWVMSDWGAVHSTVPTALAGFDQEMPRGTYFDALKTSIEKGDVPLSRLNDMVHRILRTEFARGIVDNPITPEPVDPFTSARQHRRERW